MFKPSTNTQQGDFSKMNLLFVLVPIVIMLCSLVQCGNSERIIISGKCDFSKYIGGKRIVKCSNYTEIPTDIRSPETVKHLYLKDDIQMEVLKNSSLIRSKLIALEYLGLQKCGIRVIEPGAFTGGNALLRIDLDNNMIDTLNPEVFSDLVNLKDLILRNNPIKRIAPGKIFPNLPQLITLDLSYCQLDNLGADIFTNLKDLKTLYLDGNYLTSLDWRIFRKSKNLHILSLEENPWHCNCKIKFLMETLKNLSNLASTVHFAICASADKMLTDWIGKPWNYVPKDKIKCTPKINQFVYLSPVQRNETTDNLTVKIGEDVYFDCEYSGYPRPKILWFKDKKSVKQIVRVKFPVLHENSTQILPKIEFQDKTTDILQNLDGNERKNNYNWKGRLIVRRIQAADMGTYECFVQLDQERASKSLYLKKVEQAVVVVPLDEPSSLEMDTSTSSSVLPMILLVICCGTFILAFVAVVLTTLWKRRWQIHREQRGIITESNIDFGVSWHQNDLISESDTTVTIHHSYLTELQCLHI